MNMTSAEMGALIREARIAAGIRSTEVMANLAGCSGGYYARLERGEVGDPGYRVITAIALALGKRSAEDLLGPILDQAGLEELRAEKLTPRSPEDRAVALAALQRKAAGKPRRVRYPRHLEPESQDGS